jgi:O-antigen ligase
MKKVAFVLLWFLIFSIPWQNIVVIPGLGTFTRLIGFGVVAVAVIYIVIRKKIKEFPVLLLSMALFVVWSFVTVLWSINQADTISRTITNIQLLAMVWLLWELCDNQREINIMMQAYILGAYVSIIDMISIFLSSPDVSGRIAATGFDQNELATTLAVGIPIAWFLFLSGQNKIFNLLNYLYLFFSIFGIILTGSRGGLIVSFIAIIFIPLTFLNLQKRKREILLINFIIIVFIGIFLIPFIYPKLESNIERLQTIPRELQEGTMTGRTVIWSTGVKVFKENPVIGVGARGFRHAVQGYGIDPSTGSRTDYFYNPKAPHNAYLSVLVDTGLIGFIMFLSIFSLALIPVFYTNTIQLKLFIVLFISLVVALIPIGWEANKVTWFILSLFLLKNALVLRHMKFCIIKR